MIYTLPHVFSSVTNTSVVIIYGIITLFCVQTTKTLLSCQNFGSWLRSWRIRSITEWIRPISEWIRSITEWICSISEWIRSITERLRSIAEWIRCIPKWTRLWTRLCISRTGQTKRAVFYLRLPTCLSA